MVFSHAINSHPGKIQCVAGVAGSILTVGTITAALVPEVTLINALVIPIILGSLALTAWITLTALTVYRCHTEKAFVYLPRIDISPETQAAQSSESRNLPELRPGPDGVHLNREELDELSRREHRFSRVIRKVNREGNLSALSAFIDQFGPNVIVGRALSTPLISTAKDGVPLEAIAFLAERGADFNAREKGSVCNGNTALHWAIANACNQMALEIIRVGRGIPSVNWDLRDNIHWNTPLILAICKGYKNLSAWREPLTVSNSTIAKALIEAGADVNLPNRDGHTPLTIAVIRRDPEMVEYLIAHRARVDLSVLLPLLDLSYDAALQILKSCSIVLLLDQEEFIQNREIVRDLITR